MLESFPEVIFQNSVSQKDSFPEFFLPKKNSLLGDCH